MKDHRDWLQAEQAGDDAMAEKIFAGLLTEMPSIEPGAAFVDRTVQAAWQARNRRRILRLLAAAAAALLLGTATIGSLYEAGDLILGLTVRGVVAFSHGLVWLLTSAGEGARWWWIADRIGTAIGATIATPSSVAALAAGEVTFLLALYAFRHLTQNDAVSRKVRI